MSFSCQKGEFDRFFNRLDRLVEESRPDRPVDPTGFHLWTFRSSSQAASCPPFYHTRRRLHNVPLIAEPQTGKL